MHFLKIPFTASTENVIHLSFMRDTPNPNLFTSDYNKMLALINVNLVAKKNDNVYCQFKTQYLRGI